MIESPGSQKADTEDTSNVNKLALEIVQSAIAAAVKCVEGSDPGWVCGERVTVQRHTAGQLTHPHLYFAETEYTVKNIKWITHGEFTAEKGRRQIEKFVSVS